MNNRLIGDYQYAESISEEEAKKDVEDAPRLLERFILTDVKEMGEAVEKK